VDLPRARVVDEPDRAGLDGGRGRQPGCRPVRPPLAERVGRHRDRAVRVQVTDECQRRTLWREPALVQAAHPVLGDRG
jgi:hypothetical protein